MDSLAKVLIIGGLLMAAAGAVLLFAGKIPWLGRLPGDIHISRPGYSFHFPIITCVVLSILLTIIMNLFFRNR